MLHIERGRRGETGRDAQRLPKQSYTDADRSNAGKSHSLTKASVLKAAYVADLIQNKLLAVCFVKSQDNIADCLTKALPKPALLIQLDAIGLAYCTYPKKS